MRPHQINSIDDGFSAEKKGRGEIFFFSKKKINFPKKMERAKKRQFVFQKTDFPAKMWRAKKYKKIQGKKRSTDVISGLEKKLVCLQKKKIGVPKKIVRRNIFRSGESDIHKINLLWPEHHYNRLQTFK